MILDSRLEFADAVSVAGSAGTALIGNVIDTNGVGGNMSTSENLYCVIQAATEIATGGSGGTFNVKLATDAQAAIATDGSATVLYTSKSFTTGASGSSIDAGTLLAVIEIPMMEHERYMGVLATIGTTTVTTGSINAFLTSDVARWKAYADGQN